MFGQSSNIFNSILNLNGIGRRPKIDMICPYKDEKFQAITRIWGDFSKGVVDRSFNFRCSTVYGIPSNSMSHSNKPGSKCSYSGFVNRKPRESIDFECPNSGYIAGVYSIYDHDQYDRVWSFLCCEVGSPYSAKQCYNTNYSKSEQLLIVLLRFGTRDNRVITGVNSYFESSKTPDRKWSFKTCDVQQ